MLALRPFQHVHAPARPVPVPAPRVGRTNRRGEVRVAATTAAEFSSICQDVIGCNAPATIPEACAQQLSALQPDDTRVRVEELSSALGEGVAAEWLEAHPQLLLRTTVDIAEQMQQIAQLLGFPAEIVALIAQDYPSWLATPFDNLTDNYTALSDLFSLSPVEMARVVATEPALLATPATAVRTNLFELSTALGVGSGPIMRAAPQFPALMTLTTERLTARIDALSKELRMTPDAVRSMLGASPRLASLHELDVAAQWAGLRTLLEGHENWLGQLDSLPPHLAAACLASQQLKQRLLFFKETGLLETRYVNISSILTQDEEDFASKYKGYIKWLRGHAKQQREREQQVQAAMAAAQQQQQEEEQEQEDEAAAGQQQQEQQQPQEQQQQQTA